MSLGQKWAQFEKEYLSYDWTSEDKIWMPDVQGCDISAHKNILIYLQWGPIELICLSLRPFVRVAFWQSFVRPVELKLIKVKKIKWYFHEQP